MNKLLKITKNKMTKIKIKTENTDKNKSSFKIFINAIIVYK